MGDTRPVPKPRYSLLRSKTNDTSTPIPTPRKNAAISDVKFRRNDVYGCLRPSSCIISTVLLPRPPRQTSSVMLDHFSIAHGDFDAGPSDQKASTSNAEQDMIDVKVEDLTPENEDETADDLAHPDDSMVPADPGDSTIDSLISKEIAESVEDRPLPPYVSSTIMKNMNDESNRASQIMDRKPPSLLEQIIRTHSIWYLPHIGRPTATHMLRNMESGNFIVRAASRKSCMAISVRLPEGYEMDTDHYIIEVFQGRGVRLENSPLLFQSLPYLIEHYCINGLELQVNLQLPSVIASCQSTKALQSIALLGQDFWNSDMSLSRCGSRSSQLTLESTTSFINYPEDHPNSHYAVNDAPRAMNKKRSSTTRDPARFATLHGDLLQVTYNSDFKSPPHKLERSDGARISRSGRRSQSVRAPTEKNSLTNQSNSILRRSFLKSLFGKDSKEKPKEREKKPTIQLADCQYFVPEQDRKMKNSRSAYDIGDGGPIHKFSGFINANASSSKAGNSEKQMRTFKPIAGYDDAALASSRLQPRPLRRERSDLCCSSATRLAKHNEGSPGPSPKMAEREPMRPPTLSFDQQTAKSCVDELRRKRLQSTNEMLHPTTSSNVRSVTTSPQITMRKNIVWPVWKDEARKEHRLSVPNLAAEPPSSVVQSAKALKEKMGRNVDGELGTINEGLITPVVRRKLFNGDASGTPRLSNLEQPTTAVQRLSREERTETVRPLRHSDDDETRTNRANNVRESELVWRRTSANPAVPDRGNPSNQRGSCYFPTKSALPHWSAVNSELKSRQRIAKVRPTPQKRTDKMTVGGPVVPGETKTSDYAQLSELENFKQELFPGSRDDDNVSVAGTVFNEPWDSNVWENLLDLACHGDEGFTEGRLTEPIPEEDSDSDRTTRSTQMSESDDENENWQFSGDLEKRALPSDRVTNKAWMSHETLSSKYGTIDSRTTDSSSGTLRRTMKMTPPAAPSMLSLPRAVSRYSQVNQIGSVDDLAIEPPCLSPIMRGLTKQTLSEPGHYIQQCVEKMGQDSRTIFGATLRRFIECTVESDEADPSVVVRNVRQFLNGIKNYLVKHGEGELHQVIENERHRLNANQILSIDAILESVLHKLLLKSIKPHLYHVMVREHSRSGALEAVTANIRAIREVSICRLGFTCPENLVTPSAKTMDQIKLYLRKMQNHYSPLKKLENLLRAIGLLLVSQNNNEDIQNTHKLPAADDLVRWLVYILAKTSTVGCEVEAWYMWELLPQHMLTEGDSSYYLTALFSAVHVLKSPDAIKRLEEKGGMVNNVNIPNNSQSSPCAFLRVAIPDISAGCIRYATFPGVPQMNTAKLCRVIAHQQGITNPEDFGLYLVLNGFETVLQSCDSPDAIRERMQKEGKTFMFAYKRHDAKIAWPSQVLSGLALC